MWIFTRHGYIDCIRHPDRLGMVQVGARLIEHIRALFPDADIYELNSVQRGYDGHPAG